LVVLGGKNTSAQAPAPAHGPHAGEQHSGSGKRGPQHPAQCGKHGDKTLFLPPGMRNRQLVRPKGAVGVGGAAPCRGVRRGVWWAPGAEQDSLTQGGFFFSLFLVIIILFSRNFHLPLSLVVVRVRTRDWT